MSEDLNRPVITLLYVPADRPDRILKALGSGADGVVVDLEDAVAPAIKDAARANLVSLTEAPVHLQIQVRINSVGSTWHEDDLAAVAALPPRVGVRVPKVESATDVERLAAMLPGRALHLLLESALGVEKAFELASCPQVATLGMGEADLMADLGVVGAAGLGWARGRVVNAARAAGLPAPLMSAFTNVRDLEGLSASCRDGRVVGFSGRSAIHPGQLATIREAFRPTTEELAHARMVLDRIEGAIATGTGALQLPDGTFLDLAMVSAARRTLILADEDPQ